MRKIYESQAAAMDAIIEAEIEARKIAEADAIEGSTISTYEIVYGEEITGPDPDEAWYDLVSREHEERQLMLANDPRERMKLQLHQFMVTLSMDGEEIPYLPWLNGLEAQITYMDEALEAHGIESFYFPVYVTPYGDFLQVYRDVSADDEAGIWYESTSPNWGWTRIGTIFWSRSKTAEESAPLQLAEDMANVITLYNREAY